MRNHRLIVTSGMLGLLMVLAFIPRFISAGETYNVGLIDLVTAPCLGCICEAASNCNLRHNCTLGLCGPLLISDTYWTDAGRCIIKGDNPNSNGAFIRCATDPYCAAWTVRNYVAKNARDCNQDGVLDCDDFARLHYLGARRCRRDVSKSGFYRNFRSCFSVVSLLNG